ncbi:hypothetical protein HMPREF0535_0866, partial [Limosilactobacillus reuteri MM2-3]
AINGFGTTVDHLGHSVRFKLLYERMGDDCQLVCGKMGVSHLWFPFFCLGVFKSLPQMAFLFF